MVGDYFFQDFFPSLFQISTVHSQPISHFAGFDSSSSHSVISWNFHFRRDWREEELINLSLLLGSLERVRLIEGSEDIRRWVWIPQDSFFLNPFSSHFYMILAIPIFPSFILFGKHQSILDSSVLVDCNVWKITHM